MAEGFYLIDKIFGIGYEHWVFTKRREELPVYFRMGM